MLIATAPTSFDLTHDAAAAEAADDVADRLAALEASGVFAAAPSVFDLTHNPANPRVPDALAEMLATAVAGTGPAASLEPVVNSEKVEHAVEDFMRLPAAMTVLERWLEVAADQLQAQGFVLRTTRPARVTGVTAGVQLAVEQDWFDPAAVQFLKLTARYIGLMGRSVAGLTRLKLEMAEGVNGTGPSSSFSRCSYDFTAPASLGGTVVGARDQLVHHVQIACDDPHKTQTRTMLVADFVRKVAEHASY